MIGEVVLDARNIVKMAYDEDGRPVRGTTVKLLADASLEVRSGEIHALVGENGAGKTTLIKACAGAIPYEQGSLDLLGVPRAPHIVRRSPDNAIAVIWQEFSICPHLTVVENVFLGRELRRGVRILKRRMVSETREALAALGVDIDPFAAAGRLSTAEQQIVEIAKALHKNARILILDEPTATLSRVESERLFAVLDQLRSDGIGIVLVSHRLPEVFSMSDRVTVLKDGRTVGTYTTAGTTTEMLIEKMVGRPLDAQYRRVSAEPGPLVLEARRLRSAGSANEVSIEVRTGEIVGLVGLVGAGRTELAAAMVGAEKADAGQVLLREKDVTAWSLVRRLKSGMAYVPEDRKRQGVVLPLSIQRNLAMPSWPTLGPGPFVGSVRERKVSAGLFQSLRISARTLRQPVSTLSGGNQQRVAIGKWLDRSRSVYVLDEPTRGVDVSARYALYDLMSRLVEEGAGILMISSDLPEVISMSDRIYVMRLGAISGHFRREDATEEILLARMLPDSFDDDRPSSDD